MNRCALQTLRYCLLICVLLSLLPGTLHAQPSGGPYGPIQKNYILPEAEHIYYVAPDGNDDAPGTELRNPTTLSSAISRVVTGDAIILRGGTYRTGELKLNQEITMQPYADEQPILKGTLVATKGVAQRGNKVWRIPWKRLFPAAPLGWWRRDREGVRTPLHRFNNDMVFVDGQALQSAGWEGDVDENSYFIDYDNAQVYVGVDPAKRLVEITAWGSALVRTSADVHGKVNDRKGPIIRGITFTQYAWRALEIEGKKSFGPTDEPTDEPIGPSDPATYGKEVIGTTLENVTITHCSRVAGFFRGDSLTIRQSLFSDTSTEGVYVIGSSDVLLERNIFRRNNVEELTGYYPSAVKIFNQSHRVTCRDNLVMDNPHSSGIWYDVGNTDGLFINNWVQDCTNGFFFEISKGATCVGNVFLNCHNGIFVLNSSNVHAWHNTLINCSATFQRTNRRAGDHFGWHAATGPDVDEREGHIFVNNLLVADVRFNNPLLRFVQTRDLCGELVEPQIQKLDGNVYIRENTQAGLLAWSPSKGDNCMTEFSSLADFQKINSDFESQSRDLKCDMRSLFKSPELNRYELLKPVVDFSAVPLPDEIQRLLDWTGVDANTPGAYPIEQ
ncbi:right-handed parallel beta-helix repeat-containing protein [candidate division KSB1 bacterium]|nr:right-handed parallel beta-helix repeat-containing protein [candidate division KSB1 bacterium]